MDQYLAGLTTEGVNEKTFCIDECSTEAMLKLINEEDKKVPEAVEMEIPLIAKAVELVHARLSAGGRMFYIGAGTSGRLGVLDAAECPPTFGTSPELVQAYIAGGDTALRTAVEGSEDSGEEGRQLVESCGITKRDAVVGISASGSAPFVLAAIEAAREMGAATIGIVNNKHSKLDKLCDVCIAPVVGSEVIMGSTRLKSGSSQKLVLNMLTTCVMVKLGKVYNNLMVDLKASNRKLYDRSIRIIQMTTGVEPETAAEYLKEADSHVKLAIMMIRSGLDVTEASRILEKNRGYLKKAILCAGTMTKDSKKN